MMPPEKYPTDLTDSQFKLLLKIIPTAKNGPGEKGRPASYIRVIINGILYINKTGCQWRTLSGAFCPRNTVHRYFNRWSKGEIWKKVMIFLETKKGDGRGGK